MGGNDNSNNQQPIPDREIKQNAGASASMALQAAQKAWELRQAANAAGDPDAREEILAKAINKEIEAESFGKAAKYTQSGAFQGLAAGAGLGVQPGVTLGKVTGAIVGGTVATVTGLLGGGIGSVYGAMNGPMWDLGQMASHGVRGVIGDFPNWKSTPSQKKALEKMVMQSKETQAPSKEELEQMKNDMPDDMPQSWSQSVQDMTSWRPSMPSMPKMPNMPSMSQAGAGIGLGSLGASLGMGGKQNKNEDKSTKPSTRQTLKQEDNKVQSFDTTGFAAPKQASTPRGTPKPKEAPEYNKSSKKRTDTSKEPEPKKSQRISMPQSAGSNVSPDSKELKKSAQTSVPPAKSEKPTKLQVSEPKKAPPKLTSKPQTARKPLEPPQSNSTSKMEDRENRSSELTKGERKRPRKLAPRTDNVKSSSAPAPKQAPRKLESRKVAA